MQHESKVALEENLVASDQEQRITKVTMEEKPAIEEKMSAGVKSAAEEKKTAEGKTAADEKINAAEKLAALEKITTETSAAEEKIIVGEIAVAEAVEGKVVTESKRSEDKIGKELKSLVTGKPDSAYLFSTPSTEPQCDAKKQVRPGYVHVLAHG